MACAVDCGPPLSAEVVDARFWALVGGEDWPTEEPAESEAALGPRSAVAVDRERVPHSGSAGGAQFGGRWSDLRDHAGLLSRQRSPPPGRA